ncbi:hypothetical protein [Luxibacter massiliensis]|uniref:hypothetical protein n=1 Tax=Luxibacter massiliensis TaxID=2219695 RepID=UPI000F04B487|nr:hypothetical protein [Luxibacter massiliensis]
MKSKLNILYGVMIFLLILAVGASAYSKYYQDVETQKLEKQIKELQSQLAENSTAPSGGADYSGEISRIDTEIQGLRELYAEMTYLYDSTNESLTDKCGQIPDMQDRLTSIETQIQGLWDTLEGAGLTHANEPTPEWAAGN